MVSLTCSKGLDFDTAQVDISSLIFRHFERVRVDSENDADLQFIATVLENSIPQGRGFLKSLVLNDSRTFHDDSTSSVDYRNLIISLIKIIEVQISLTNIKASPELKTLKLFFNERIDHVNLDSCLDAIFGLDQIIRLYLGCKRMSLEKVKSVLNRQGGKKTWRYVGLTQIDQKLNDSDILEICSYLPNLRQWIVFPRSPLTIDGAREWKRICPKLTSIDTGGGFSPGFRNLMYGLGITVIRPTTRGRLV
jgi:hypothetical protein